MEMTETERLFYSSRPKAQNMYLQLKEKLLEKGEVTLTVHKTQISFCTRRTFACVWHPPVKRLGEEAIMVSVFLPAEMSSPRLFGQAEIRPGRFVCHMVLSEFIQLDQELMGWLKEAYRFACRP